MIQRITRIVIGLLFFAGVVTAQPKIDFTRVINNWPTIELWFTITCNGSPKGTQDKSFFRVKQNGVEVPEIELWCPLGQVRNEDSKHQRMNRAGFRCGVAASLVLDVRAAMAGNYLTSAKAGAVSFIDQLDGVTDEAAIIAFHANAWVVQSMTTIKPLNYNAINSLQVGAGSGSVWDGIFTGLTELITNGVNPCRGVVVLSGGPSIGGSRTVNDVIAFSNNNRVHLYVVGLGNTVDEQELMRAARQTGGKYYPVSEPSKLVETYQSISSEIMVGGHECMIIYTASCPDGSLREVELSLVDFCNGSDSAELVYKAPFDPSQFSDLNIHLPNVRIEEDSTFTLPVTIDPAIAGDSLRAARFVLPFDTTLLSFEGIVTDHTTILQDSLVQYVLTSPGIEFATRAAFLPSPSSLLLKLVFKAKAVSIMMETRMKFESWKFIHGCYTPRPQESSITIYPKGTLSSGSITTPLNAILRQNYPNPFNPSTVIEYELPVATHARLAVFDVLGREVRELVNERRDAGLHRVAFDADGLPGGVYLYRLEAGGKVLMRQMAVVK